MLAVVAVIIIAAISLAAMSLARWNNIKRTRVAAAFVTNHMMMKNGGVRTNYKNQNVTYGYPGGSDVLSESQGLLMRFAVGSKNEALFAQLLSYVKNALHTDGLLSYRYSDSFGVFPANAAIDDFRIIRALLEAADAFHDTEYRELALTYANQLYGTNVEETALYDYYNTQYDQRGTFLTLCYADFKTMELLGEADERWIPIIERAQSIVLDGYISDEFPLFATSYDYPSDTYNTMRIETAQALMTVAHLAEIDACPRETIAFIKDEVLKEELVGAYSASGAPLSNIQSTANYAIASIIGKLAGDKELQTAALERMEQIQIMDSGDPLYGAFGDSYSQEAYSFDNLYALLALEEAF